MPRVKKIAGGQYHHRETGTLAIGDTVKVDGDFAAYLCEERGDFEVVDDGDDVREEDGPPDDLPPFDPSEYTVDDLESELDSEDYGGSELHALAAAEEDGKNRETALEAIKAHIPTTEEE
ncbi:hypothetical protein [Halorussus halobius]|uniref:hypothetical protein n=1 Tax=Halorussus halobius TaxID=1710537 RepID=UPI001092F4C8|nr:hypothetical protein [Halorussus halobius]